MKEFVYLISDIELGGGDILDDFTDDDIFANFLHQIVSANGVKKITLVLNGDVFDFLKAEYKGEHPRYVTEEVSLWKLERMIEHHPVFFRALKGFLRSPLHKVFFVIGNHDADVVWPGVQKRIRKEIEGGERLDFGYFFDKGELHAQHGHLTDTFYRIDHNKPIAIYKGENILDLSWGSYAYFTHLHKVKKKFPREEQLYPKPLLLERNPLFNAAVTKAIRRVVRDMLVINPFFKFYDPTAKIPYLRLIRHTFRFGFEFADDEKFLEYMIEDTIKVNPTKSVLVLGHSHIPKVVERRSKRIFITDTWRDEFDMTRNNKKKDKTYVEVKMFDSELGDVNFLTF
jgi:UDP-2,3-diacylglucosamine pyrophosphatase LpxH